MSGRVALALTGLRLAVRGLWFRRSTAVIVLGLAVVASAASVVAPLYSRAAQESIVRSTLQRATTYEIGMHLTRGQGDVSVEPGREETSQFASALVQQDLTAPTFGTPRLALQTRVRFAPSVGPNAGSPVVGRIIERAGVCAHLPRVTGRCARSPDEVMLSRRSLRSVGGAVGDTVRLVLPDLTQGNDQAPPVVIALHVVGAFDPVPVGSTYWAGQPYFQGFSPLAVSSGLGTTPARSDPGFVGAGTMARHQVTGYTLDVPVLTDRVHLSTAPLMVRQVRQLQTDLSGYGVGTSTNLPPAIDRADHGRDLVRIAAPLAVTQLVLLSWWTLYLVVGSATEERSPELGLAKLRGLTRGQTGRFGLAETVLLLVVAAPLGMVLGYAAVRAAAGRVFAPGTHVALTGSVVETVSIALAGAAVTVALSARRVLRRPVGDLLRRVPGRPGRRGATVIDGAVVALAAAGIVQLVNDRGGRPSPVALLAPGMVAVVGAIVASRWLVVVARSRSSVALDRGSAARLVSWSGVARRPGTARIASVLAFATCLLLVGVQAWSVADRNRAERASAEVGAAVVLGVRAPGSSELLSAVRAADPGGRYAMAAVHVTNDQTDPVLAVDGERADRVIRWGAPGDRPGSVRRLILPPLPRSLIVGPGPISLTGTVGRLTSPSPVDLTVRLDDHGSVVAVPLGQLVRGPHGYTGTVPARCSDGCRLAAFGVAHPVTDLGMARVRLTVQGLSAPGPTGAAQSLPDGFADPAAWRATPATTGGPTMSLRAGQDLVVNMLTPGGVAAEVVRGDAPEPLPAYAGSATVPDSSEPGAPPIVTAGGLSGSDARFLIERRGPLVPRVGRSALLVDLGLALRGSTAAPEGNPEVWLARDDRAAERRLTAALARHDIRVTSRQSAADVQRGYAGDGAVLALRLLVVCGGAAVLVAVGALLVAAYVGRRQRAYEVAALRVVGLRRGTVGAMLLRENVGTVLVALLCGAAAALVASWVVLPSLPQFDQPSTMIAARYAPAAGPGWTALLALAAGLGAVGLVVAALQLRAGRSDRLREGVR